ncbi:hypothetical protein [Haloarcula sp. JP-L23]|uniref:hypothetical protein n=1 Tax=Haloarcula sp. JP-L23 TaxID=2716717 RepID=UPI00140F0025|nr:hypothetical protein G9465_19420 [Haloarcula sp. JP-L23]
MRTPTTLATLFAVLSVTTLLLGVLGLLEGAPGVWPEGWPVLVVVHALLAVILGYYVMKTS